MTCKNYCFPDLAGGKLGPNPLPWGKSVSCGPIYFEEHQEGRRGGIYVVYIEKMRQKKKDVERQEEEWTFYFSG